MTLRFIPKEEFDAMMGLGQQPPVPSLEDRKTIQDFGGPSVYENNPYKPTGNAAVDFVNNPDKNVTQGRFSYFLEKAAGVADKFFDLPSRIALAPFKTASNFLIDTAKDVIETGKGIKSVYDTTQEKVQKITDAEIAGEQGKGRSMFQATGTVAGGLARGFGELLKGAAKVALPQEGEDWLKSKVESGAEAVISAAIKTDKYIGKEMGGALEGIFQKEGLKLRTTEEGVVGRIVNDFMADYEMLSDKQKRDVDSLLGVADFSLTTAGAIKTAQSLPDIIRTVKGTGEYVKDQLKYLVDETKSIANQIKTSLGQKAFSVLEKSNLKVAKELTRMTRKQVVGELKWGKDTPKFLANQFIVDDKGKTRSLLQLIDIEGGTINTERARDAISQNYSSSAALLQRALDDSYEYVSMNQFYTLAKNNIEHLRFHGTTFTEMQDMLIKEMIAQAHNLKDHMFKMPNKDLVIRVGDFNKLKSGFWDRAFDGTRQTTADALASNLNFILGNTSKDMITSAVPSLPITELNKLVGDYASAKEVLWNAHGQTLSGRGALSRHMARLTGVAVGSAAGGGVGAAVGAVTSDILVDMVTSPKLKVNVLSGLMSKLSASEQGQKVIKEATELLRQRGQERAARILLEAPKIDFVGGTKGLVPTNVSTPIVSDADIGEFIKEFIK